MASGRYYPLLGLFIWTWLSVPGITQPLHIDDNQQVFITENTTVVLTGGLHNQGILTNLGQVRAQRHWINENSYTAGPDSEVVLADSLSQQVSQPGQAFRHLTIDGGGAKNLLSEVRVTGILTLAQGIVIPHPEAPLILEASATVAGGSDTAYVENYLQYQGDGVRTFPLGLNSEYLPITLLDVIGSPTLRVSVRAPHPPAIDSENIERVSTARYWQITPTEGAFEGALAELTVTADDGLDDLVGAIVVQSSEPGGSFSSLGQSDRTGDARQGSITSELPVTQPIVAVGLTSEFSLEHQVLIPSAFAPEAPNPVNRLLKIYATTLIPTSFSFRIFDRWGTLVYHTNVLDQAREEGWDGQRQSDRSLAPPAVYQYHLQGVFENGTPINQTGTITLFR